jgi:hypothetical protein
VSTQGSPPQKRKPPDETGGERDAVGSFGGQTQKDNTSDVRELQGIATARHVDQRPPVWPEPPGTDSALELAALMRRWPR